MKMAKNSLILTIVAVVIVGVLGFYGGIQYQKSQRVSFSEGTPTQGMPTGASQQGRAGKQGNAGGSTPVSGEITSVDKSTITIKTQDGSSKIIIYSISTKVNKTSEGSTSDLKVGEKVTAIGLEGSDGAVTAQSISVGNAMLQGMPGGSQPGQNGQ
jgi:hypothetical protein